MNVPSLEELRSFLTQRQVPFTEKSVQSGTQLVCQSGEIFTHYDRRGKVVAGGVKTALAQEVTGWAESGITPASEVGSAPVASSGALRNDVFIVYGHDTAARENLELLLHKMKLNPIVLANLTPGGDTIIEKLEKYLLENKNVGFACVLLTPDDEGYPAGDTARKQYRARQNVILELGMVLARLGRQRVAILRKQSVEQPSDIAGLIYISFDERVDEVAPTLYRALLEAGYNPSETAL
jgi:predicted nucleotide-binding protein